MFQLDICSTSLYKCVLHVVLYVNLESLHSFFLIQRCALICEKSYCVTWLMGCGWLGKKGNGNMVLVLSICWAGCAKQLGWNICIVDYLVGVLPLCRQCKATQKPLQLVRKFCRHNLVAGSCACIHTCLLLAAREI
jgi:hypothetical protein